MKRFDVTEVELAEHQTKAIDFICSRSQTLVNYETGTGKTLICLQSIFNLHAEGKLEKALIVCTKSSILSFEDDLEKTNYPLDKYFIIKKKEDLELLNKPENMIFLIQYETLLSISLIHLIRAFKAYKSGLFIDEVHRVKSVGKHKGRKKESLTAGALNSMKQMVKVVLVGLTATTMTSELEDSYRVLSFIKPKCLGGTKWFKEHFCIMEEGQRYNKKLHKYIPYHKIVGYKNLDDFLKYTKHVMIQFFPKLEYKFHILSKSWKPDSPRALKYEELAAKTHGKMNDKHSTIRPRLQRLVDKSPTKRLLLRKLIERTREDGLIIYLRTRKKQMFEYIQGICEEEGLEVKIIVGSTKLKKRKEIQKWCFQGEPKDKCLLISDAAAQSMNLQYTHNLCMFETTEGIGRHLQLKGRIGRMFSKWKVYDFYFLVVKGTIDEYNLINLQSKKEVIGKTSDSSAIPTGKLNKMNGRVLKRYRDAYLWRKQFQAVHGGKLDNTDYSRTSEQISKGKIKKKLK